MLEKIYVINLDHRSDRLAMVSNELKVLQLYENMIRVPAIKQFRGCRESHLKVLEMCDKGHNPVVIEDDAQFHKDFYPRFQAALAALPTNFDILYLGYNLDPYTSYIRCPSFVSPNLLRLYGCLTTHAYIVNRSSIEKIRNLIIEYKSRQDAEIDTIYYELGYHEQLQTYGVYPMIANQCGGFSDIVGGNVNYTLQQNVDHVLRNFRIGG